MKKTLRMATVFTGAAACAAAFGPTAGAATTAATAGKPLPGNITEQDCTAADAHWFHLYWPGYADHGPTCLASKGTKEVDHSFVGWCPGETYGWLRYLSINGSLYSVGFDAFGTEITQPKGSTFYVISVHVSGHSGNYTCPS
jgi:hypothetical protein